MSQGRRNVLLLSNLGLDMGLPAFRLGSYRKTLLPMARRLAEDTTWSVRILTSPVVASALSTSSQNKDDGVQSIAKIELPDEFSSFMVQSVRTAASDHDIERIRHSLMEALGDWTPDVILCWEARSEVLRQLFPLCVVLDVMPSMFMRVPYPAMLSFDPNGLYDKSSFCQPNMAPEPETALVSDLRGIFSDHFEALAIRELFEKVTQRSDLNRAVLLPFQITQYFGWADTSFFTTQAELMRQTHKFLPSDSSLICTQYTAAHLSEAVLTAENLPYWRSKLPKLVYDPAFDVLDNFSQYIIPHVQSVVSVSSTLGLQARLFRKPLISPASSHLRAFANSTDLSHLSKTSSDSSDALLELYLSRSCFLSKRLLHEPGYLVRIIDDFAARRTEKGADQFPATQLVGNATDTILKFSPLDRSQHAFEKLAQQVGKPTHSVSNTLLGKTQLEKVLSFDVFDTLVRRSVIAPKDVFAVVQAYLRLNLRDTLPAPFLNGFVALRQAAERMLTETVGSRDDGREEISIHEVYQVLAADFGLGADTLQRLIDIEQEMELLCLQPRAAGQRLFQEAKRDQRKILIVSDFIHDKKFVQRVLEHCGYSDWDALYVSSDVGLKKHSGALFDHVAKDQELSPSQICHIGDNSHGDVKMAKARGWAAHHVPSTPARIRKLLRQRPMAGSVLDTSVFLGAVFSNYADCFLDRPDTEKALPAASQSLIATQAQMGFLTLGPAMYYFGKWLIEQAEDQGCTQMMFFARDTVLPYNVLQDCFAEDLAAAGISICYIPVSRLGAAGLDLKTPRDVWAIKIDDFGKNRLLTELMETRFLMRRNEIDAASVAQWTAKSLDQLRVRDVPIYAIYRIAFASVKAHSKEYFKRLDAKRALFCKGLDEWGCDRTKKTLAVDIGYVGTLTRKLQGLFQRPLISRFFVSYSNSMGSDPIDHCDAFFQSRLTPQAKEFEQFLRYSLIIETMLNESAGSVEDYQDTPDGVRVLREPNVDKVHSDTVSQLHDGVRLFAQTWHKTTIGLQPYIKPTSNTLMYALVEVLRQPTAQEAQLLAPLVFDNKFAGHKARRIIELAQDGKVQASIWQEGADRLHKKQAKQKSIFRSRFGFRRSMLRTLARVAIKRFTNERLLNKFDRDPVAFFRDSSKPFVRRIGVLLYG